MKDKEILLRDKILHLAEIIHQLSKWMNRKKNNLEIMKLLRLKKMI